MHDTHSMQRKKHGFQIPKGCKKQKYSSIEVTKNTARDKMLKVGSLESPGQA